MYVEPHQRPALNPDPIECPKCGQPLWEGIKTYDYFCISCNQDYSKKEIEKKEKLKKLRNLKQKTL